MTELSTLLEVLPRLGWRQISGPWSKQVVFEGMLDDLNVPLRIVLPDDAKAVDVERRIGDALDTLFAAHGKDTVRWAMLSLGPRQTRLRGVHRARAAFALADADHPPYLRAKRRQKGRFIG